MQGVADRTVGLLRAGDPASRRELPRLRGENRRHLGLGKWSAMNGARSHKGHKGRKGGKKSGDRSRKSGVNATTIPLLRAASASERDLSSERSEWRRSLFYACARCVEAKSVYFVAAHAAWRLSQFTSSLSRFTLWLRTLRRG